MPTAKHRWIKKLATHRASLYAKRMTTLFIGAALSVGGASEAFNDVHFMVQKDLDRVRVVRKKGENEAVVARLEGKYTANSVFKLARILPDRYVTQQADLFDAGWFGSPNKVDSTPVAKVAEGLSMISEALQEEFFKTLPFGALIHEKAEKYDVDPALVAAVIEQESRFRAGAISPVGARGLMQLMPRTGSWMGAKNLHDPEQNVDAGVKYLKYLNQRFDGDTKKVIAAYNAGEGVVQRYSGTPPYRETRTYVKNVLRTYEKRQRQLEDFAERTSESAVGATQ